MCLKNKLKPEILKGFPFSRYFFFFKIDKIDEYNNSDSSFAQTTHRRSVSANDATSHRRIPFVHRFSFKKPHTRTLSSSSQISSSETLKTKEEFLSADLVLRVDIIRGRNLSRDDEVRRQ